MRFGLALLGLATITPPSQSEISAAYEAARALVEKVADSDQIAEVSLRSSALPGNEREYWLCGKVRQSHPTRFIAYPAGSTIDLEPYPHASTAVASRAGENCHSIVKRWAAGDTVDKSAAKAMCEKAISLNNEVIAQSKFEQWWMVRCGDAAAGERHQFVR